MGAPERQEGDHGKDSHVDLDLGQVVVREEHGFPEVAEAAVEVGHERQQAVGGRKASRCGERATQPGALGIGDRRDAGQPLHRGQCQGQRRTCPAAGQHAPPTGAIESGRDGGVGGDQQGPVEHRLGRASEDHQRESEAEQHRPTPTPVPDDVQHRQEHERYRREPRRHVDVIGLTQHDARAHEREGGQDAGRGRQCQGAQEEVHPDPDQREQDHLRGYPGGAIGQDHEEPDQGIERSRVETGQQRGPAEHVLVPERKLTVPQHGTDEHMQRIVLLEVVAGQHEMAPEEIREDERRRRKADQHGIGPQRAETDTNGAHLGTMHHRRCQRPL